MSSSPWPETTLPEKELAPLLERIDRRLQRLGLTDRAASLAAGRSADLIRTIRRQHVTGRQQGISMTTLVNLAGVLRTTPQWLINGTEPEELDPPEMVERSSPSLARRARDRRMVLEAAMRQRATPKFAGEVAAGVWRDQELPQGRPASGIPIDARYPVDNQSVYEVRDNSLDRVAQIGDFLVVVDRAASGLTPRAGDIVIVSRTQNGLREVTARRFELKGSEIELSFDSTDQRYNAVARMPAADLGRNSEFSIDGVVRGVYRRLA